VSEVLSDRVVWGYAESEDSEGWSGADSREMAIDSAYALAFEQGCPAYIVEGQWVDAEACAAGVLDLDDMLERMDEYACDNGPLGAEDPVFEVKDKTAAAAALEAAFRAWARDHVSVDYWEATGKPIPVDVCRAPIPEDLAGPTNWTDENGGPYCCEPLVDGAACPKHPPTETA